MERSDGIEGTSRHPQSDQIHIGNLPHHVSQPMLEELFALCGDSFTASVIRYSDHGPRGLTDSRPRNISGNRAYGYLTFQDTPHQSRDMEKALFFNASAYNGLLLNITRADQREYGTFFGGIDKDIPLEKIQKKLQKMFPGRVNLGIHVDDKQEKRAIFVNFYDDASRHRYLKLRNLFGSNYKPQLKEYKKMLAIEPSIEGKFIVFVSNIPSGISRETFERIFTLCGPISEVSIQPAENAFTNGTVTFTTKRGFDYAMCFDKVPVKNWPLRIRLFCDEHFQNKWEEYPHLIRVYNFDQALKLAQIELTLGPVGMVRAYRESSIENWKTLLVGFRSEEFMKETLLQSGKISLGGKGNAVFQQIECIND